MTTDYRAELQLLFDAAESFTEPALGHHRPWATALERARALLDQPVAEGPSDEEIEEWADDCPDAPLEEMDPEVHGWRRCFTAKEFSETIRAAIARWGHPTPQPVAVSERLPGPEDCDAEERCWLMAPRWILPASELTHWLPANALPLPAGEGAS